MVKKVISVNVDLDTWLTAKAKVVNISSYLNDCLRNATGISAEDKKMIDLQAELEIAKKASQDAIIRTCVLEATIKELDAKDALKRQELADNEQFNRWICPVCKKQNFMDAIRCNQCNLPTRNESKTTIVNIKGDGE